MLQLIYDLPLIDMVTAIYMQHALVQFPLQSHHHALMRPTVGAGGVEGAAEEVLPRHAPLLQHPQDGRCALLGSARIHLRDVDETLLACVQ